MDIEFASSAHRYHDVVPPRLLSSWEKEAVDLLLAAAPLLDILNQQAATLSVQRECTHCPTVWFDVDSRMPKLTEPRFGEITTAHPVGAMARDADGVEIQVLLMIVDGSLSSLDVMRVDGESGSRRPPVTELIRRPIPSQIAVGEATHAR